MQAISRLRINLRITTVITAPPFLNLINSGERSEVYKSANPAVTCKSKLVAIGNCNWLCVTESGQGADQVVRSPWISSDSSLPGIVIVARIDGIVMPRSLDWASIDLRHNIRRSVDERNKFGSIVSSS